MRERERRVCTPKDAADLVGCTAATVNRLLRCGRIDGERGLGAGAAVIVRRSRLGRWELAPRRAR